LEETIRLLETSRQSEEQLREEVADLSHAKELIQTESDQRLEEGIKVRQELDERLLMLVESQDREKALHCELEEIEVKMQNAQQQSAEFENELNVTSDELERTKSELNSTIDREIALRGEVTALTEAKGDLERELENEKQGREGDRIGAECSLNETREMLEAKAKSDLEELQTNMNLLLEDERASFRKKLEKAHAEYQDLKEKNLNEYEDLKRKMTNGLEAAKADYEARIQHVKHEYTCEIERLKTEAEEDREKLLAKGKGMLRDSKGKADEIIRELEEELDDIKQTLSDLRKEKDEYEHKTRAKVSSYKHKLQFSMSRINDLSGETEQLNEVISVMEREKTKLLEENERYRRQLGMRYGADGKTQNQMEMLQKEFNAVLDENRSLKKRIAASGSIHALGAISEEPGLDFGDSEVKPYARGGVSGSTLAALREEYEEQLQAMNDEKRELMMKNSAAVTDVQKAEQRSWELEKEVERLKQDVTSAQLALQRAELHLDDSKMETSAINEKSFFSAKDDHDYAENLTSGPSDEVGQENLEQLLDLSVRVPSAPATPKFVLSPRNHQNWNSSTKKSVSFGAEKSKGTPAEIQNLSMSLDGPTLLELTQQNSNAHDAQPECKQS
jgi:chromosome segregation ATPase